MKAKQMTKSAPGIARAAALAAICGFSLAAKADSTIQFNRDIRPILTEKCFHCHGPDPGSRKAGLRLDTKEGFFSGTEKRGPTVVPGNLEKSELWRRIVTKDEDDLMPPPKSHKPALKPEESALLKKWIEQGAPWQPHWSFIKPERPEPPPVKNKKWPRNPIDSFVLAKLEAKGLKPAPEADRRTLARRVSLDVTGLPPTPEEVEAFVADKSPDAYVKYVRKAMSSPRWGEHRGRYWLDAARYGDTHGLHFDNYREMWLYRDWVINAFNRNQPFDEFTVEQMAGDLLPNPTRDQQIATGFHRCNITTNEGGTIEEENLVGYARDRVETTSWVWLGLTANCAVCHDHKFDPVTMKDFYSMSAFFRNTTQPGLDGNVKESSPSIVVPQTPGDESRWAALPAEINEAKKQVEQRKTDIAPTFAKWSESTKPEDIDKEISSKELAVHIPLNEGNGTVFTANCGAPAQLKFNGTTNITWKPEGKFGSTPVLQEGGYVDLGATGDFEDGKAFSYGAWVNVPKGFKESAAVLARMDDANSFRGWDLWLQGDKLAAHFVNKWPDNALKVVSKKSNIKQGEWQHLFVTYDGSGKKEGAKLFVNGVEQETDIDTGKQVTGSLRTPTPLLIGKRSGGAHFTGGSVQDVRVYGRGLPAAEVMALARNPSLRSTLSLAVEKRTKEQTGELLEYFLSKDQPYQERLVKVSQLDSEREAIRLRNPVTHVQVEKMDTKPMAAVLFRGQYDKPKEKVTPAVIHSLHPMPKDAPGNRLGLARWLVSPENPLTARVTVNRFWQELFGVGIVKTSEDFGIVGDPPSNQELLDWMAVEFQSTGWDVKKMFELLLTSATYRQSAATTPEKLEKDPANRLLSRGPRFRMDAEMVRDYALKAGGLLGGKIGGPSVKPYQPDGVWEAVAMIGSNTRDYKRDNGDALYRRSVYTFWKRAAPPASMEVFNAPSRETSCLRRERTNTPLQALATMNDVQFVEAARHLAENALAAAGEDEKKALDFMARRLLARPLTKQESKVVDETRSKLAAYYYGNSEDAKKLLSVGESKPATGVDPSRLAAWTMVANQLMNLDEVLNK